MTGIATDAALVLAQELAATSLEPRPVADHVVDRVVPNGYSVQTTDGERFAKHPRRKVAHPAFYNVDSFTKYALDHYQSDRSSIYVADNTATAIIDDHGIAETGTPGHRDHQATLDLRHTPEWLFWTRRDNSLGEQVDFAEHIEDGIADIVTPDGATMLEVAQSFHAASSTQFKSAKRLRDGNVQLQRMESMSATAGEDGDIEVPQVFVIRLAVFEGEDPIDLVARLRYRVRNGQLSIGYKLERPDRVLRETTQRIAERLSSEFSRVYIGRP